MKKSLLVITIILSVIHCYAQDYPLTDSLKQNLAQARTPAEKILWLGELADFYRNLNNTLSDEYKKQQLEVAELSRDRELMIKALLSQADINYGSGGVQENINKAKSLSARALELAKSSSMDEYIAWGYIYLSRGARSDGENDQALNYSNMAMSLASTLDNDSLKISALNASGHTYLSRKEKILAFRQYLQALNLAETIGNYEQQKNCYYNLSYFYANLEDYEKAKDYLFKTMTLTKKNRKPYDRLNVYSQLGQVYAQSKQFDMARTFYETAMKLADTLQFEIYKININGRILDMYLMSNEVNKALQYFNEKKELRDFMTNAGMEFFIDHAYGYVYAHIGKLDSAGYYFKKAEPGFETKVSGYNKVFFYSNYADYYTRKGDHKKALEYLLKSKKIADERGDISMLKNISQELDSVHQRMGDYKNAYFYNTRSQHYKDSLQQLAMEKDVLKLEVDNENRRKEREAAQMEEAKRERHNIQYMGITTGIAGVFILLVMLGIFSVSKTTIRILGFFAFIFLFEFIILLADNQIHHWTHGEPWKILAIKIGLISILLPLHHYLEEKVIHYLTSRKLIEVNAKGLLHKLSGKTEQVH